MERVADINAARNIVHRSQNICGGDPVIGGTRVPIRMLGEMVRNGASISELAKEYDLTKRQIDLALLYDKLHPQRGRPSLTPREMGFGNLGDNERLEIEELGEYPSRAISYTG